MVNIIRCYVVKTVTTWGGSCHLAVRRKGKMIRRVCRGGRPRHMGTKNQRTSTLARRFRLIFTSCVYGVCTHTVALFHVVFVFCAAKLVQGMRSVKRKSKKIGSPLLTFMIRLFWLDASFFSFYCLCLAGKEGVAACSLDALLHLSCHGAKCVSQFLAR